MYESVSQSVDSFVDLFACLLVYLSTLYNCFDSNANAAIRRHAGYVMSSINVCS